MTRTLIIPAAGAGSRLGSTQPKLVVPVAGRPMLQHLFDLHRPFVDKAAVIVHPASIDVVRPYLPGAGMAVELLVQESPTGMLDALLVAHPSVAYDRPDRIWITWCDQVAVHPRTAAQLAGFDASAAAADVILPTCRRPRPYVHLERDTAGRVVRVLHRREGDAMPDIGESDTGLFDLSLRAFLEWLPEYSRGVQPSTGTRERNFLPFVAWAAARVPVLTFPCTEPEEAVGVNTPEELAFVDAHLRARSSTA